MNMPEYVVVTAENHALDRVVPDPFGNESESAGMSDRSKLIDKFLTGGNE